MGQTLSAVLIALASPWLVGVPLRWLLSRCRPLERDGWLEAPFLGLAGLVLTLHNLVYLDVPIRVATPWLWVVAAAGWLTMARRGALLPSLRTCPWGPVGVFLLVYLWQALGLLCVGADEYLGRALGDRYNYVVMAQSLADRPFSASWADIGQQPWLSHALTYRDDRLGQSVLHAFLLSTTGLDARQTFDAIILLSPALVALAMIQLARRLGATGGRALLVGAAAGLMPGVTLIHLFDFLSHGLALPLLLFFLVCLHDVVQRRSTALARTMLTMAATFSVYPEMFPILAALAGLVLGGAWLSRLGGARALLACGLAVVLSPALFLPGFVVRAGKLLGRSTVTNLGDHARPLLDSLASDLWVGDHGTQFVLRPLFGSSRRLVGVAVTALALMGLLALVVRHVRRWRSHEARPALLLALVLLALVCLPPVVLLRDPPLPYQFWKLALTVAPLLALGLAWAVPRGVALGLVVLFAAGTGLLKYETATNESGCNSHAGACRDGAARFARRWLEELPQSDVILATGDSEPDHFRTAWLCHAGRRHRLWLTSPVLHYRSPVDLRRAPHLARVERAPDDVNLLFGGGMGFSLASPGRGRLLGDEAGMSLWRLEGGAWAVPVSVRSGGESLVRRKSPLPAGTVWEVELAAKGRGEVQLTAFWLASAEGGRPRRGWLLVETAEGRREQEVEAGPVRIVVPVEPGHHTLRVTLLPDASTDGPAGVFPLGQVEFSFEPR